MAQVKQLIEFVPPEHRKVLRDMFDKKFISNNTTLDQLYKLFPMRDMTEAELDAFTCLLNANKTRFIPKLDYTKRCEILALHYLGHTNDTLARMYGVNRRTITHIFSPNSPSYKGVKADETGIGKDAFIAKYATMELKIRANEFKVGSVKGNNKFANRKRGLHLVRNQNCEYDHRVYIEWREDEGRPAGWYYKDLDSDSPDQWFQGSPDPDSLSSSQACYSAMIKEIMDKLG